MRIHKEGYTFLLWFLLILASLNLAISLMLSDSVVVNRMVFALSAGSYILVLLFFRSPVRKLIPVNEQIYAPADGKLVALEEVDETEYFNEKRLQVSIFMSPLNVHYNKYPVSGKIKYVKYHPGHFFVAWHPKSSQLNERSTVVIEMEDGREIMIKQIAGAVARRIVTYPNEGDVIRQGDELGFIKFGSRVDLLLPADTEVNISLGSRIRANKTVVAKF
ncbi:MAG: phosphatidylserine decarboxylase family protein [Bacteroidales bacterium]|nr:phosphatidylserine decarboxylase family protein [Bacteroidales bacterium]